MIIKKYYTFKNLPSSFLIRKGEHIEVFTLLNNDFEGEKEVEINLLDKNAKVKLHIAVILSGPKKVFLKIKTIHNKGNNFARVEIKSFLKENSNFNLEGLLKIKKYAYLSDSYLKHSTLIDGNEANVTTSPQLEINANNVKASHGASIGSYKKSDLFYLQSRGLSILESKNLIAHGFIEDCFKENFGNVLNSLDIKKLAL